MGNSIWTKVSIVFELVAKWSCPPFPIALAILLLSSLGTEHCRVCPCPAWGHSWRSLYMAEPTTPMLHPFRFSGCVMAQAPGELLDGSTAGQWPLVNGHVDSEYLFIHCCGPPSPQTSFHIPQMKWQRYKIGGQHLFEASGFHQIHCPRSSSSGILAGWWSESLGDKGGLIYPGRVRFCWRGYWEIIFQPISSLACFIMGICGLHAVRDRFSYPQRDSNTEARIGAAPQKKSGSKNEKTHLGTSASTRSHRSPEGLRGSLE